MIAKFAVPFGFVLALTPWLTSAWALALGAAIALTCGNPYIDYTRKWIKPLLSTAIVGLGAGMNLLVIARAGMNGVVFTVISLALTMLVGYWVGRLLKTPSTISVLLNVGTAICGGSAIAAVSSAIRAPDDETSVSLAVIFVLNAVGLLLFPPLGHFFGLDQAQFGLWAALAIHDTSSVVGATMQYGSQALEVGTTVKLVRALWIVPVTLLIGRFFVHALQKDGQKSAPQYPWFILGFLGAAALVTWLPQLESLGQGVAGVSRHVMTATLFLIGTGMTQKTLKKVGLNPLIHGVLLWALVAGASLMAIQFAIAN